jgi:putative addiction module CopG family antidote
MALQPTSLNVSLTPELERFTTDRVASGRYQTASEVVRAVLRLLEQDETRGARPARPGIGAAPRGAERA